MTKKTRQSGETLAMEIDCNRSCFFWINLNDFITSFHSTLKYSQKKKHNSWISFEKVVLGALDCCCDGFQVFPHHVVKKPARSLCSNICKLYNYHCRIVTINCSCRETEKVKVQIFTVKGMCE